MYEDILDDPEVQELIEKYDGNHQNDVPLDEFGKPLSSEEEIEDETIDNETEEQEEDPVEIDESLLDDFVEEVPEIDYTPQTEFSKTLDLDKIDDGFQKYVLTHLEPLELVDEDGKTIRAYTYDDIPKDFKLADQLAVAKVSTELARLEAKGDALKKEYDETLAAREEVLNQNEINLAAKEGLTEAISNGEFPKLELTEDGKLDTDSKINQLAEDVLTYQKEVNKDRSPSRAVSFDTALNRFKKDNPDRFKDLDGSLAREDKERVNYAKRTSRSSQKSTPKSNSSIYDNLSREEFDRLLNDPDFDVSKLL